LGEKFDGLGWIRTLARLLSCCKTLVFHGEVAGDSSKVWTAVPSAIASCVARAIGATQEAHFISYCRLLPPRETAKLFGTHEMVGRGGGDRTHDLRLKRPLLYH
jgi:hypothetical protein